MTGKISVVVSFKISNSRVIVGRGTVVGIATPYGLDDSGFEPRLGGAEFSAAVQTGPGVHTASRTMGTGSLPGGKAAVVDHPPHLAAKVKGRVQLYVYSPSTSLWHAIE